MSGGPARRAVIRWAIRLFRREWRQQLLAIVLLTLAVAATVASAALIANIRTTTSTLGTFGNAGQLIDLPGDDPGLTGDIAAIQARAGTVAVVGEQSLHTTGSTEQVRLRAEDPASPYLGPTLALRSGRYPSGPGQVAVTGQVATLFDLHVGGRWQQGGRSWQVVGTVENPNDLTDSFALLTPGQLSRPDQVTVLFDGPPLTGLHLPSGTRTVELSPPDDGFSTEALVLVVGLLGLVFTGLIAVSVFTVLAQRRVRALGMFSALGATDRHIRLVMLANGAIVGVLASLAGGVLGAVGWMIYAPNLETTANHRIDRFALPWDLVAVTMVLAVVTAVLAAWWPARAVSRMSTVAAMSGRPGTPQPAHRFAVAGVVALGAGLALLAFAQQRESKLMLAGGMLATIVGSLFLAPLSITGLAALGRRAPISIRLALRDLARYRSRSGAALAAVSFAIAIAATLAVALTARYADVFDLTGANLPSNELLVQQPFGDVTSDVADEASQQAAMAALGTTLHASTVALETPGNASGTLATVLVQSQSDGGQRGAGPIYVATPQLLRYYGIDPGQIDPDADVLTSRAGLDEVASTYLASVGPDQMTDPHALPNPKIQTIASLPGDTDEPNLLLTEHAMRQLGSVGIPSGWLVRASGPLTSDQINTARQTAVGIGDEIDTAQAQPSLTELSDWATEAGILLALGVLAMTIGLIRRETAGDLRTLTAVGATRGTRRMLTAATSGALGLLGGLIGTAVAYLGALAYYRNDLSAFDTVPTVDLALILLGLPLVAVAGGWLFAGREPAAIARQPLT